MKLDSFRNDYKFATLSDEQLDESPLNLFEQWLNEAINSNVIEPTAMAVSTIGVDGFPQSRIVLLKESGEDGFVFFTNYESEKGKAIFNNSAVCLLFFWPGLERQVRITGFAEKTANEDSNRYFALRPLLSQAAAIVSAQSKKISSRENLENRFKDFIRNLPDKQLERPENWGGFIVKPLKMEFWQGRENRLHDRILYEKSEKNWTRSRLAP